MLKKLLPILSLSLLFGCAQQSDTNPTLSDKDTNDFAKQYVDGEFSEILNKVDVVKSDKPRDFTEFNKQAEQVIIKSPSMARMYQPLYRKLNEWAQQSGDTAMLDAYGIKAAQLGGADKQGNVLFTGYFSPVMELRHRPNETFKYPVYGKPNCSSNCPTRAEIYNGALNGKAPVLGYSPNLIDPFMMEVQGSGYVHYEDDDTLEYFAYAGKNNKAYVSIGRVLIDRGEVAREDMSLKAIKDWVAKQDEATVRELLEQNPSYVFFAPKAGAPVTGSAGIPLLPMASVAGDRSILPMGTPILAEVPLLNADGSWSGVHQLRMLIVLDTGGAVKRNHLDLYHGIGARAGNEAGHYKHFGRVWKLGLENTPTQAPWALSPEKIQ
ncbi:murein transglycosylase A [Vibrio mytili]|uniref:murein transglycosylase A n=1 Tax=Vibrio mytili TaxID=50718 RepID=UPI003C702E5D